MPAEPYPETLVPASVRFPVELEPPEGFRPEEPASWPRIDGLLPPHPALPGLGPAVERFFRQLPPAS